MNARLIASALALCAATQVAWAQSAAGSSAALLARGQTTTASCSVDGPGGSNVTSIQASDGGFPVAGLSVTVNNNTGATKNAYISFSADANVTPDAEIRLLFTVDGGAPAYRGTQNLASAQQYWATRTALAVVPVPPGVHTIAPFWYISGDATKSGVMDDRCMFVTF